MRRCGLATSGYGLPEPRRDPRALLRFQTIPDRFDLAFEIQHHSPGGKGALAMSETNAVVAIYDHHLQAEEAVKELQRAGVDMNKRRIEPC